MVVFFYANNAMASAGDSIEYAVMDRSGQYFFIATDSGRKIERRQNYTSRLLTSYQEYPGVARIYPDSNTVVGIAAKGLVVWDTYTGRIAKEIPYPADMQKSMAQWYRSKYRKEGIYDYDPGRKNVVVCPVNQALVINVATGDIVHKHDFEHIVDQVCLVNNSELLVYNETMVDRIFALDLATKAITNIRSSAMSEHIGTSADKKKLFVAGHGTVSVYDEKCNLKYELKSGSISATASTQFVDNFDIIAQASGRSNYLNLFLQDGKEMTYTQDDDFMGFSAANNNILFWNGGKVVIKDFTNQYVFATASCTRQRTESTGTYHFNGDKTLLFVANDGNEALVHDNPVTSFNDKVLVSGDIKGNMYTWDKNGKRTGKYEVLSDAITCVAPVNDHQFLVGSSSRLVVYDVKTKQAGKLFRGHRGSVTAAYYNSKMNLLATGATDGHIYLWDYANCALICTFNTPGTPWMLELRDDSAARYYNDSGTILEVNMIAEIRKYTNPEKRIIINTAHNADISSIAFSSDGNHVLSVDDEGAIKIWDVNNLVATKTLFFDNSIHNAAFSGNGSEIICHDQDNLYVASAATGLLLGKYPIPPVFNNVKIHALATSAALNRVVWLANNVHGTQLLFNLNTGKYSVFNTSGHQYAPYGVAVSPDGKQVATLGNNVIIYDALTGAKVKEIPHPNSSNNNMYVQRQIEYSPDGKLLLMEGDNNIRIWNLETNSELTTLPGAKRAVFTGNNKVIYSGNYTLTGINVYNNTQLFQKKFDRKFPGIRHMAYDGAHDRLVISVKKELQLLNAADGNTIKANRMSADKATGELNEATGEIAIGVRGKVKIFDWRSGREKNVLELKNNRTSVPRIMYSRDGKQLFCHSSVHNTEVYDEASGKLLYELPAAYQLKVTDDNRFAALSNMDSFYVFDVTKSTVNPILALKEFYGDFMFTPDNGLILEQSKQKKNAGQLAAYEMKVDFSLVSYDNLASGTPKRTEAPVAEYDVSMPGITRDSRYMYYKCNYSSIRVLDLVDKKQFMIRHTGPVHFLASGTDSRTLFIADDEGAVYLYDILEKNLIATLKGHSGPISNISFWNNCIFTTSADGNGIVWNAQSKKRIVQINAFCTGDYLFMNKDNYYMGTQGIARALYFQKKDNVYPFEQYDLFYNRPDLVVKSTDPQNTELYEAYHKAYVKRMAKMGLDPERISNEPERPTMSITRPKELETKDTQLRITATARDESNNLDQINVWINDIPVYGANGISLKGQKTRTAQKELVLALSQGSNKIQVSCRNEKGIESLKETFEITCNPAVPAKPDLYIIAISVAGYQDKAYTLKYAHKDGTDLVNALLTKAGNYTHVYVDTLFDADAVREKVTALREKLNKTQPDDQVIVFISGHGLLDKNFNFYYATYDCDFNDPAKRGIAYDQVEALLDGIPARKKLLLMDACHSGEVDKQEVTYKQPALDSDVTATFAANSKGLKMSNTEGKMSLTNSFLLMQDLFANLNRGSGTVVIAAAAGDSYALESDRWRNGVFTYSLLEGLKEGNADGNKDGRITIGELQTYVYKKVTDETGGQQKPTTRQANLEYDWYIW